jgi:5-formyltetrahydrofolate cyclo-ligase
MSAPASKTDLRKVFIGRRRSLTASFRREASEAVCARLSSLVSTLDARLISCYLAFAEEVETDRFIRDCLAAGREVAAPLFDLGTSEMRFCRIEDLEASIALHECGIRMPRRGADLEVPLSSCDLVVVPGVAFTPGGYRLGYGRGFYDRSLSSGRMPRTVGLAYEIQMVEQLPTDPHDVPVDLVITEERVYSLRTGFPGASASHDSMEVGT